MFVLLLHEYATSHHAVTCNYSIEGFSLSFDYTFRICFRMLIVKDLKCALGLRTIFETIISIPNFIFKALRFNFEFLNLPDIVQLLNPLKALFQLTKRGIIRRFSFSSFFCIT